MEHAEAAAPGGRADAVVPGGRAHPPVVLSERSEPKDPAPRAAAPAPAPAFVGFVGTPMGRMMMRSDGCALTGLCLEDWWWAADADDSTESTSAGAAHVFDLTRRWLGEYFGCELDDGCDCEGGSDDGGSRHQWRPPRRQDHPLGHQPDWTPPLAPGGTPFRREVWSLVREIPWGETVSYGELAAELSAARGGRSMAAQAVGGAVKHNPITIIVPCHRVVGAGRAFGGYGGRLDVKAALLAHEGVDLRRFDGVPD